MIVIGILVKTLRMSLYTISQKKDGDFCRHLNASNPKKVAWLAGWLAGGFDVVNSCSCIVSS